MQQVDTAVAFVRYPFHVTLLDQLTKRPMQPLPRDAENTDEIGDRRRLAASYEIEDPVVDSPERKLGQMLVRAANQPTIGEKEQFQSRVQPVDASDVRCSGCLYLL